MRKIIFGLLAFSSLTSFAAGSDWEKCPNWTNCLTRVVGDSYVYRGAILKVRPGADETVYSVGSNQYKERWVTRVQLELVEDFEFTVKGGTRVKFPKNSRVNISQAGTITGVVAKKTVLLYTPKGATRSYKIKVRRLEKVSFYKSGTIHHLDIPYDEDTIIPIGNQLAKFRISLRFHENENVEYGRVYTDLYFTKGDTNYIFPGERYQGGLISLHENGSPNIEGELGKLFIKYNPELE